jgi:phage-related protein
VDRFASLAMTETGLIARKPYEKRVTKPTHRAIVVLHASGRMGVAPGFIKKTRKTPADELDLARRPTKEMLE